MAAEDNQQPQSGSVNLDKNEGSQPQGTPPPQQQYQQPYPPQQQGYPQGTPPPQHYQQQQQYPPQQGYPQQYPPQQQAGAYPVPMGAPQPAYMGTQQVVVQQVYIQPTFGVVPVDCVCSSCQTRMTTKTSYVVGSMVWLVCVLLIIFGCWLGCCLIPFAVDSLKDVKHKCSICKTTLYRFDRMSGK